MPQATQTTFALESPLQLALSFSSFQKAKQTFKELFPFSSDSYAKIPCLNEIPFNDLHEFNQKLVRFRGMLQDNSFSSELYPLEWKSNKSSSDNDVKCSYLTDLLSIPQENEHEILRFGDRTVHYLVSLPGYSLPSELNFPSTHVCKEKFPISTSYHQAMFVKYYEGVDYKLGDIVEVCGIFEIYPSDTAPALNESLSTFSESITDSPNLKTIPWTIHVIFSSTKPLLSPVHSFITSASTVTTARQQLINVIQPYFFNDLLATEYFLLQLMMKKAPLQYQDQPSSTPLGTSYSSSIEVISFLLPTSTSSNVTISTLCLPSLTKVFGRIYPTLHFPLSLQILNKESFAPYMNAEKEELGLIAGRLQIAPFTLLLIDETVLSEGALNERGVNNLQTLMRLITSQRLECQLPYSTINCPLPCIPILFCEGKSILPLNANHFEIKLQYTDSHSFPETLESDFEWLTQYLAWAQHQQCYLDSELAKLIEDTFVEDRKKNKDINQTDLQLELSLAIRLGQSLGETTLSKETWERARRMEKDRKMR